MFVNKNTKKIIFTFIIAGIIIFLPSIHFASEHENEENIQEKKPTKYDIAKNLAKDVTQGYGTYLSGTVVHEFGHWFTGKIIHKCNGFFCVHPTGSGTTHLYYDSTNREIILELLKEEYIKNYQSKLQLNQVEKSHPLVYAAGPLFGIGYNLLVHRTMVQSNMLGGSIGALGSLARDIANFSPFGSRNDDGNKILQCFNIDCPPHKLSEVRFQFLAVAAAFVLAWNVNKAVLPAAT